MVILLAGVINEAELKALDEVNTPHGKWWVPFVWAANIVKAARKEGRICDDYLMKTIIDVSTISPAFFSLFSAMCTISKA